MKTMKNILMIALLIPMLISSCAKDGDTGPQGPPGPASTLVKTMSFTLTPGDWQTSGSPGLPNHALYVPIFLSAIDQDIMNTGAVIGYIGSTDFGFSIFPFVDYLQGGLQSEYRCAYLLNTFEVNVHNSDYSTPTVSQDMEIRVVIIDGSGRAMNPDINWNNYSEVANRFKLNN
jgi:hypothetical protein